MRQGHDGRHHLDHHGRRRGRRHGTVAPTSFLQIFQTLTVSPHRGGPPEPVCCTDVVHNRPSDDGSTRCDERIFRPSDCCTSVVHKPSKTASSPSSRSRQDSGRRHSGLMVRGRGFYLRMRVPRSLEATVGPTHLWRSLGDGECIISLISECAIKITLRNEQYSAHMLM